MNPLFLLKKRLFEMVTGYKRLEFEGLTLLYPKNYDPGYGTQDLEMYRSLSDLERRSLAIDIGAFVGSYSVRLAAIFQSVVAVEPNPVSRSILNLNLKRNRISNVKVLAVALDQYEGTQTLHIPSDRSGFSLGSSSLNKVHQNIDFNREVRVATVQLDNLHLIPDFVKIDAEGREYQILLGGQRTVREVRPVLGIEVHEPRQGLECRCSVCTFLRTMNYDVEYLGELERVNERTPVHWIWAK